MAHTPGPWRLDDPIHAELVDATYHYIDAGIRYGATEGFLEGGRVMCKLLEDIHTDNLAAAQRVGEERARLAAMRLLNAHGRPEEALAVATMNVAQWQSKTERKSSAQIVAGDVICEPFWGRVTVTRTTESLFGRRVHGTADTGRVVLHYMHDKSCEVEVQP